MGVKPSSKLISFIIIASPSGAYYAEGLEPGEAFMWRTSMSALRRAVTGFTKCGGNYAASLIGQHEGRMKPGLRARCCGWTVWSGKYVEEVGSMNCFFKIERRHPHRALRGHGAAGHHAHELHRAAAQNGAYKVD